MCSFSGGEKKISQNNYKYFAEMDCFLVKLYYNGYIKCRKGEITIMAVLENLEPKKVFQFFEELCQIPHGTFDIGRISDYCAKFAEDRGLKYIDRKSVV